MTPQWQEGVPANIVAAAEDADVWLALMESCIKAGVWKFGQPDSLDKLRGCRRCLRTALDAAAEQSK